MTGGAITDHIMADKGAGIYNAAGGGNATVSITDGTVSGNDGYHTAGQALHPALARAPDASVGVFTRLVVAKMPLQASIFTPRIKPQIPSGGAI